MRVEQHAKGRVLIVEDEPSILRSYSQTLAKAGFEVTGSSKSSEALRRTSRGHFDVVFSDFSLPGIDGLALLRRLHQSAHDLPVILMLDREDNRLVTEAAEAGALQSLFKPIAPKLLEETAAYGVRLTRSRQTARTGFRRDRGERGTASSVSATEAKNEFGHILERVTHGDVVFITKHDSAKAVLISVEEYATLSLATETKLDALSSEFDDLLARMQTPKAKAGMKAAFDASPEQLGKAAVVGARGRG